MKSGPRFTALFVALTAILFASLVLALGLGASGQAPDGGASAAIILAILVVFALAVLAAILIKAVHDGRA